MRLRQASLPPLLLRYHAAAMTSEIDATLLRCNSCWLTFGSASLAEQAFKTSCNHLFCGPCATRTLYTPGKPSLCPLCDQPVEDIHKLPSDRSQEAALHVFAFAAF